MAHATGTYYIAPAAAPDDEHSVGYDGNVFASADDAEAEIHALAAALGGEPTDYVVCRRGGADRNEADELAAIEVKHKPRQTSLCARWLPASRCWQVQFGGAPTSIDVDGERRTLFSARADLDRWCRLAGLRTRATSAHVLSIQVVK